MPTPFQSFQSGNIIRTAHVEQFIQPIHQLESGDAWYADDVGGINNFQVNMSPAPPAYSAGMFVNFQAASSVTGPSTLNVNSLGAVPVVKEGNVSLIGGDITDGQMVSAVFDGEKFQLLSATQFSSNSVLNGENILVYSEVLGQQAEPISGAVTRTLPAFTFETSKSYFLSVRSTSAYGGASPGGDAQLVLKQGGEESLVFPSEGPVRGKSRYSWPVTYSRVLPSLSGTYDIELNVKNSGAVEVQIFENYGNLVYADASSLTTSVEIEERLSDFTAFKGRSYLVTLKTGPSGDADTLAACTLRNSWEQHEVPLRSHTLARGPRYSGHLTLSNLLTGLDGTYSVWTRGRLNGGISIEIRDVTH